jgi:hypothetical protein
MKWEWMAREGLAWKIRKRRVEEEEGKSKEVVDVREAGNWKAGKFGGGKGDAWKRLSKEKQNRALGDWIAVEMSPSENRKKKNKDFEGRISTTPEIWSEMEESQIDRLPDCNCQ